MTRGEIGFRRFFFVPVQFGVGCFVDVAKKNRSSNFPSNDKGE